jgi:hypothetical protein
MDGSSDGAKTFLRHFQTMINNPGRCLNGWFLAMALICTACQGVAVNPAGTSTLDRSNDEIRFRNAWDQAQGHLHYDELVRAWGAPASLRQTDDSIVAQWQWEHSFPLAMKLDAGTSPASGMPIGSFGERLDLTFNAKTKLLHDWKYSSWGPRSPSSQHGTSSVSPPTEIRN